MGPEGRARLFVALDLPGAVRGVIGDWAAAVAETGSGLRAVAAEDLHVTLCFLGALPLKAIEPVAAACDRAERGPIDGLSLGGVVWLPSRQPRVLAVELKDPERGLGALQADLAGSLASAGLFAPERRRFLPHVTAARVRRGEEPRSRELAAPRAGEFAGRDVTLYRSHLGSGPARYEALHRVRLSGG